MITAIHKYVIPFDSLFKFPTMDVEIPKGATFLYAGNQAEHLVTWWEVDPKEPKETRQFQVFMTGDIPVFEEHHLYRGTVMFEGGHFVVHLYEIRRELKGGYIKVYQEGPRQ